MVAVAVESRDDFSARVQSFLREIEYRRAESENDYEAICRLRYDAYLREGAIEANSSHLLTDRFDGMRNSWTFGIFVEDRLASSIRVSVATPQFPTSPAVAAFPDLLKPELEAGKTIVDPNRFVADLDLGRKYPALPYVTVRLGFVASEFFNTDLGLATARKEHQAFYRRVFGLRPLCPPRPYPTLTKPLSLMAIDYSAVRQRILNRYPSFASTLEERLQLFGPPQVTLPEERPAAKPDRRIAATGN